MSLIKTLSIEEELEKNSDLKKSDIDSLREWCKNQPHLPEISDSDLIIFLHSNYYKLEPTKTTIDSYYTLKTSVPEFFADRDPLGDNDFRKIFKVAAAIPLKQLTKEGYHIILGRIMETDTTNYVFISSIKFLLMAIELWLFSSGTIQGHVLLFDVQNITMGHATKISPLGLKKFFNFLQEGLPVRLKGMHFINVNPAMQVILRMMRPFMKKELTEMLYIHPNFESIEKCLPIEAFPNELGGKAGPLKELHEIETQKIDAHREWFLEEQSRAKVDESKRPKKVKSSSKHNVAEGSFNKLDID